MLTPISFNLISGKTNQLEVDLEEWASGFEQLHRQRWLWRFPAFRGGGVRVRTLVVAILAWALSASVPIAAALDTPAARRGEIGGPPSIALGPVDEGKRRTPDIVIGRGRTYGGGVELVAYGWLAPSDSVFPGEERDQFCIWIEHLPDEVSPGTCDRALTVEEGTVAIDEEIMSLGSPALRQTEIGGRLAPGVATSQSRSRIPMKDWWPHLHRRSWTTVPHPREAVS